MYRLIEKVSGKAPSVLIILVSVLMLQVAGCSDSGSVGGGLPGTGSNVEVDSIDVTGTQIQSLMPFSGSLPFISVGNVDDPLFGELSATGLLKPGLPEPPEDFNFGSKMTLRLVPNTEAPYGDTTATQQYNLVEIAELFRGNEVRLNDEIALSNGPVVGSFTLQNEDSVDVSLSSDWVEKYGEFFTATGDDREENYIRQFFGLAIVPQNEAQVIAINQSASRFIIPEDISDNTDGTVESEPDTVRAGIFQSAYTLDRTMSQGVDTGTSLLYSTFEQILKFDFDFLFQNLGSRNISRVELVFFRDNLALNQTLNQIAPDAQRPAVGSLRLYFLDPDELDARIGTATPVAAAEYNPDDKAYHFDLTGAVQTQVFNNEDPSFNFYVAVDQVTGVIGSTAIFNSQAAPQNRPKIIVTSINTENN